MGGYAGQFLQIDLTAGTITKLPLDKAFARNHIGGLGFSAELFLEHIKNKPHFDAYAPENPFIVMTGPLTGIPLNGAARWTVCAKSPLTGFWGDANVGGYFGAELKCAGYDGMIITGAAPSPVYIYIHDELVELRDASQYWGLDTYTVNDRLLADLGVDAKHQGHTLSIGPAGEGLVRFAALIHNKGHAAGRTGLGAVWGSKKLKAIYVCGSGKVKPAHPARLKQLRGELKDLYAESIGIAAMRATGTVTHMDVGIISGDIPIKNWNQTDWDQINELGPAAIEEKIHAGHRTCFGCGVACKKDARVPGGPFKMEKGPAPEYETVAVFGTMCLNPSIESVAKANEICNRMGMDTISCGATIAFAIECFEHGLIRAADTDGLQLAWGNSEAIIALTEKIGKKEGIGAVLAEGSARAAAHFGGQAADFLTTVKGLEAPMHDPRNAHGFGLAYGVSPRGACHEASLTFEVEGGTFYLPDLPGLTAELPPGSQDRAQLNVVCQDYGMVFSHCAVFCNLGGMPLTATRTVEILNCVTGFDYTLEELLAIGRRLWLLKRGITGLFGARRKDDQLPKKLMQPLPEGPTAGSTPDMELMLAEFYKIRGLTEDGVPTPVTLAANRLEQLAELFKQA